MCIFGHLLCMIYDIFLHIYLLITSTGTFLCSILYLLFKNNEYKSLKLDIMKRGDYRIFSVFVAPGGFGSLLSVRRAFLFFCVGIK